jgi:hypothetical protein
MIATSDDDKKLVHKAIFKMINDSLSNGVRKSGQAGLKLIFGGG